MRQCLLVELDCLLDTRLGTLIKMDESVAEKVVQSNYQVRDSDRWNELVSDVEQEDYDYLYRKRDVETLKLSKLTSMIPMLGKMVADIQESALNDIEDDRVQIHINSHPYKLSKLDQEALKDALLFHLGGVVELTFVNIPLIGLMPDMIGDTYDGVILYDIDSWLKKHQGALMENRIPGVVFMCPAIYFNEKPNADQLREEIGEDVTPFQAIEMVLSEYMSLRLIDVSNFSLIKLDQQDKIT